MAQKTAKEGQSRAHDDFAQLSDAFHARLSSDRVHFVTLSAALAQAEDDPRQTFEDLRFRAHKLNGAAGIFEALEVMTAADALEQAAIQAIKNRSANTDEKVWSTLEALVGLLGNMETSTHRLSA